MTDPVTIRRAGPADAEGLAAAVVEGVREYPAFAPPGWEPPSAAAEAEHLRALLADEEMVCLAAESGGALVGKISILPAARAPHPVEDPALAHVSNLFVRRDHQGSGLARTLHHAALEAAATRGFTELRLFVATGQARARRFYEREGWAAAGEPFEDPVPGLTMVEYRRPV